MEIPIITPEQMRDLARRYFPTATLEETRNSPWRSWWLVIEQPGIKLEFFWGPMSGFGVTDLLAELTEDDNPFAPYGLPLDSLQAAEAYLDAFAHR